MKRGIEIILKDASTVSLLKPYNICKPLIEEYMAGRKKLDRTNLHARVALGTAEKLKEIAYALDYIYDGEGSTGQLLDAIASGKLILIATRKHSDSEKTG
ncbi:hypothetical protein NUACC21_44990 [Scytonema sp. NUACC21]